MSSHHEAVPSGRVSVAVVNFNGECYLQETLESILANVDIAAEVMVVDNASSDGSVSLVRERFPGVRVIARQRNDGPGPARNLAIASAVSDYVLLLDNDVSVQAGAVDALLGALQNDDAVIVAMPSVRYANDPAVVQYCGANAHFMGTLAPLNAGARYQAAASGPAERCTSLISAALMVNKRVLGSRALFNEELFIYLEDHEAGYRCGILGQYLVRVPGASCLHREGTQGLSIRESGAAQPMRVRQTVLNRWYILATLFQTRSLLRYLPALLCYELVAFFGLVLQGGMSHWFWAVKSIVALRSNVVEQRRWIRQRRRVSDALILKGGSYPFNREIESSALQRAGQKLVDGIAFLNWSVAKPRHLRRH